MKEEHFILQQDIEEFALETRNDSVQNLCETLEAMEHDPIRLGRRIKQFSLDEIMTVQQVVNVINEKSKKNKNGKPVISATILASIIDEIKSTVCGAVLSRLAANGDIECSWNDKTNDMEFWVSGSS